MERGADLMGHGGRELAHGREPPGMTEFFLYLVYGLVGGPQGFVPFHELNGCELNFMLELVVMPVYLSQQRLFFIRALFYRAQHLVEVLGKSAYLVGSRRGYGHGQVAVFYPRYGGKQVLYGPVHESVH